MNKKWKKKEKERKKNVKKREKVSRSLYSYIIIRRKYKLSMIIDIIDDRKFLSMLSIRKNFDLHPSALYSELRPIFRLDFHMYFQKNSQSSDQILLKLQKNAKCVNTVYTPKLMVTGGRSAEGQGRQIEKNWKQLRV